ncbi:MarR family winged helix-turn-helix transcriptional regulator [Rhodococcus daqingensis]|uniref:MarR family winged helix-turn-helix transcriptional regulator n=1 Tax=Rhodococcus daqingensis TaxID=2479363 RepID=A0ABW2S3S2_9NOCA
MSSDLNVKGYVVGQAMQRYQAAVDDFDREMARLLGVNNTDLRCLEMLLDEQESEVTPRAIADNLGLTTGSVTTMLDRLERAGYLTRARHTSDRRKVLVHATPAGRECVWKMLGPMLEDATQNVTAHFTVDELDVVERFVTRAAEVQRRHVERLRARDTLA